MRVRRRALSVGLTSVVEEILQLLWFPTLEGPVGDGGGVGARESDRDQDRIMLENCDWMLISFWETNDFQRFNEIVAALCLQV